MKRILQIFALGAWIAAAAAPALQISEPPTVFYGRVFQRGPNQDFLLTEGELVWTIRNTAQGGREYTLKARLEPLDGGRFSYRLAVPHQVLAYDLVVSSKAIPMSAVGSRLQHAGITINGLPLTIVAPAIDSFTARQAARAATYRVDLELTGSFVDADGDGLPDWWEDRNGLDKWDPADAATAISQVNPSPRNTTGSGSSMTLEKWREANFSDLSGDLEQFSRADPDADGIVNLLEYAFDLNPNALDDEQTRRNVPRMETVGAGEVVFRFQKRTDATDLSYLIEFSEDLMHWAGRTDLEFVQDSSKESGLTTVRGKSGTGAATLRFMRVRVERRP